jgi:hypothetical protein
LAAALVPFLFSLHTIAQTIDLEFFNETGIDMRVRAQLVGYTPIDPNDCTYSITSSLLNECIDANDVYPFTTDPGRFILWVEVYCNCSDLAAAIYCGDDPVVFTCDMVNQYIMGLAHHGWRVEPY